MATAASAGTTRTVDRALALLAEVCAEDSIGLSECARRAELPASTALRLLRTLEGSGFVTRDEEGCFRAGSRLIQLGALALGRQSLVRIAEPVLDRLVGATGESAYLTIAGPGGTAIHIAMVEGTHAVRHTSWVGRSFPTAGLVVGRALADDVPACGYVSEHDRLEPDVTAIVAPILRPGGVAAAMSLLGPSYRIDDATLHRYGAILAEEARVLSGHLGATPSTDTTGQETRP
ncbi:IclR family transcriptional regulator [Patulibacter sp.]|uniref:IclR family transcriptional regulator n=1 Tax=Patulibacter sp. TaxID=1912859 RepID=UPI00271B79B7|nr:helix-turn-helix domain-containing protein [Patulibacter sp.]MDO9407044.1 helix-turn-helix domain-containing protein [Patulibacter sp.]